MVIAFDVTAEQDGGSGNKCEPTEQSSVLRTRGAVQGKAWIVGVVVTNLGLRGDVERMVDACSASKYSVQ